MARINIKASVSAPEEINIPLVRADHHETGNIFRVCFEVFLSLFSGLMGYVLSIESPDMIHYISLAITGGAAFSFMGISVRYSNKCKEGVTKGCL